MSVAILILNVPLQNLIKGTIALFIILDPIGNIPIFMSLTKEMNTEDRSKVFRTATLVGLVLLLIFTIAGNGIFSFFGVSIYSFMIAGGILLLIISTRILISGELREASYSPENIGAVPIATPLLAGPGALTAAIITLQTSGILITVIAVLINFSIIGGIFLFINPIYKFLGKTGSLVIARVLALIIAAIAIGYILQGLTHFVLSM
jgi:multiple antibiotic resistance protein